MTMSHFPALHLPLSPGGRRLAYSAVGDAHSHHVLVCLPGLLETRATFDPLLKAAQAVPGLRVISLDHCGRGDSDPLPHDAGYAMSVYLQDTAQLLREVAARTSEMAGDGTTTATVLAQAIVREGMKYVAAGMNPMDLKRGIDKAVTALVEQLKKQSKPTTTSKEIAQVGTISANSDEEVGRIIAAPFEISLSGAGSFGGKEPSALWAGVNAPPDLARLAASCETAVRNAGLAPVLLALAAVLEAGKASGQLRADLPVTASSHHIWTVFAASFQGVIFADQDQASVSAQMAEALDQLARGWKA